MIEFWWNFMHCIATKHLGQSWKPKQFTTNLQALMHNIKKEVVSKYVCNTTTTFVIYYYLCPNNYSTNLLCHIFIFVLHRHFYFVYLLFITSLKRNVLSIWPPSNIGNFCKFGQISCSVHLLFFSMSAFFSPSPCALSFWPRSTAFLLPYEKTLVMPAIKFSSRHLSRKPTNEYRKYWILVTVGRQKLQLFYLWGFQISATCQTNVRFKLNLHTKKKFK